MCETSPLLWLSVITERIMKFRHPEGFSAAAWGANSDLLGLFFLLRDEKKVWAFTSYDSAEKYKEETSPWTSKSQFRYRDINWVPEGWHNAYIYLEAERGMSLNWFHSVPKGALSVSLWETKSVEEVELIKKDLQLKCPLWSESVKTFEENQKTYALLAYSQG